MNSAWFKKALNIFFQKQWHCLKDLHRKAWEMVGNYLTMNLRIFGGLAKEAESTVLPLVTAWVDEAFSEVPECRASDDHCVVMWANLPSCGVLSVHRYEWCITSISNVLAIYRKNGIAVLVHPNRGQAAERTYVSILWSSTIYPPKKKNVPRIYDIYDIYGCTFWVILRIDICK